MAKPVWSTLTLPCADLGRLSVLPSIFPQKNVQVEKPRLLDEYDEVFFDVGQVPNLMPYRMRSLYNRGEEIREIPVIVMENAFLKATFIPSLGGKLWSLFDKAENRELLYVNDIIRPCNLALCNAWTSGGVEWNMGMIGHTPFTCEDMNVAFVEHGGLHSLRMYAYERVREAVYQMDFMLPEGSRVLLCRMRIKNINSRTIPMYWYSNIAVPQGQDTRVLAPADSAYYSDINSIGKVPVPFNRAGVDITYAGNARVSVDYFYKIKDKDRKYEAAVNRDGRGLFQASTSRQKGRKLFVWGSGQGGQTWQQWLTKDAGPYIEIQAGVNPTQYECVPMPPLAAWEWVEAYGAINLNPETAMGAYKEACEAAERAIEAAIPEAALEDFLLSTRDLAHAKGQTLALAAHAGWGALERLARGQDFESHLDFGEPGAEQAPWLELLNNKQMTGDGGASDMVADAWFERLKLAEEGPARDYHLGLNLLYRGDSACVSHFERAAESLPLARYALAVYHFTKGDERAVAQAEAALPALKDYLEFAREYLHILNRFGKHEEALAAYEGFAETIQKDGRARYERAFALARLGQLDAAEGILMENGALIIDDQREGVEGLSDLWLYIQERRAHKEGRAFDRKTAAVPPALDFRMA